MNVLHVYKTAYPYTQGGVEEVIRQLTLETHKLGVHNRIVCLSGHCKTVEIIERPEATIYCYPLTFEVASCGFSWQLWREFPKLSAWADIIHYQFPWPFADLLALRSSKPYIISYQSDIIRQQVLLKLYQPLMQKFLANAAAVVATSPKYIASSKILSQLKHPAILIPNGINTAPDPHSYQDEKEIYQQRYGSDFFLFIGVFRYYKGLRYLLEAAKKIDFLILLAGTGDEMEELQQYVKIQGMSHVHFLGKVTNKQKYALISLARALVLPSCERSEAYGMVLLEAARQGTAMLSTELESGTSYINQHNKTGLVVEAKNSEQLKDAITKLNNKALATDMGHAAYNRYQQLFTSEQMAKVYIKLYTEILQKYQ